MNKLLYLKNRKVKKKKKKVKSSPVKACIGRITVF